MKSQLISILLFFLCFWLTNVFLCLSLWFYNRYNNFSLPKNYYLQVILFGIIYLVKLKISHAEICVQSQSDEEKGSGTNHSKTLRIKALAFLILYILCMILFLFGVVQYYKSTYFDKSYYDRYGVEYSERADVMFYSREGQKYKFSEDKFVFFEPENPDEKINAADCYVDKDGYFVIIDSEDIKYNGDLPMENPYCLYDSSGNFYADATIVYWNEKGDLVA